VEGVAGSLPLHMHAHGIGCLKLKGVAFLPLLLIALASFFELCWLLYHVRSAVWVILKGEHPSALPAGRESGLAWMKKG